jgi:hypothetical protein
MKFLTTGKSVFKRTTGGVLVEGVTVFKRVNGYE